MNSTRRSWREKYISRGVNDFGFTRANMNRAITEVSRAKLGNQMGPIIELALHEAVYEQSTPTREVRKIIEKLGAGNDH